MVHFVKWWISHVLFFTPKTNSLSNTTLLDLLNKLQKSQNELYNLMWGFIACQECIFSSSEVFWNKCKVAHITPPNHLQVALNRNSVNRVFNCMCVCVCVHSHIYLSLPYTIMVGTPS